MSGHSCVSFHCFSLLLCIAHLKRLSFFSVLYSETVHSVGYIFPFLLCLSNRIGKTRDLFKKIGDTKGTFHAKMGTMNDRYGKELTEAEDIKKRWQEYRRTILKISQ